MNAIIAYASDCYNFDPSTLQRIDSGSNTVFTYQKSGQTYYLRISKRALSQITAEIDWILYLQSEIKVPNPILSNNNKRIETYEAEGKTYVICAFAKLPGVYWDKNDPTKWNESVFRSWGKTMGKMHRLTKAYHPAESAPRRPLIESELVVPESIAFLPNICRELEPILEEANELPKDINSYGLIHSDLHQQNFLIGENEIHVLDFDDSYYGWFALDIGTSLYHGIWWGLPDDKAQQNDFAHHMVYHFMQGYVTENKLSAFWLSKIYLFMRFRQISALSWFVNPTNVDQIVPIDLFNVQYDVQEHMAYMENKILYEGCTIDTNTFLQFEVL